MRKESISRLLLSFLTAFVLVAGVFAAASLNNAIDWEAQRASDAIAPSGPDMGKSDVGEAPTSANGRDNIEDQVPANMEIKQPTATQFLEQGEESTQKTHRSLQRESSVEQAAPEPHGTRIAPGAYVDANGPYGTPSNPLLEGEDALFEAQIVGDVQANYEFRWDIDDDGQFETDWDPSPSYFHLFTDDHQGVARVQAFDGTTTIVTKSGIPLDEDPDGSWDGRYWGTGQDTTWGWEFSTSQEIEITELGFLHMSDMWGFIYAPGIVYKLTIWDDSGSTRLVELSNPSGFPMVHDSWNWFTVSPAYTLPQGDYLISAHAYNDNDPWYENAFPGVENPGTSPDGIVDIGTRYVYYGDAYPWFWDGDWGVPAIDFKYEYEEKTEIYLEDTADVFVQNIAPFVTDATTIPSGVPLPEGSPVDFTANFIDPGISDEWWFRYTWGDGDVSDWIKIPKYEFSEPVDNILYYCDFDLGDYGRRALDDIGFTYTDVGTSETQLVSELESGTDWDLVLVQNPNYYWSVSTLDALNDYVVGGGKLIYETWLMGYNSGHPLWGNLGVYYGGNIYGTQDIYEWDLVHPIFNSPNELPSVLNPTNDYMGIDGHWIEPYWDTTPVCGYSPTYNPWWYETGIAARDNKQTIFHSFVAAHYQDDEDGDGISDMTELFVNEIVWMLGGEIVVPFPEPMALPVYQHVYVDDHPYTLTEMDMFDVTVEVMDDDHAPYYIPPTPALDDYVETQQWPEQTWLEEPAGGYGDAMSIGDDQAVEVDIGFDFYYYGEAFDSIYVCSNGFLDFDDEHIEYWMSGIPQGSAFDNTLYPAWSDLNPSQSWANVYTMTIDDPANPGYKIFIVTFDDVPHYWMDGTNNFQVWLRQADFTIHFNYMAMDPIYSWYTYTIGIEGPSTGWFVESFVGSYPPSYMSRVYTPTRYKQGQEPVYGLGSDSTQVTIFNVRPTTRKPAEFVDVVKENGVVNFGVTDEWGFRIEDPALKIETEDFWYRIDYDDGTVTDWMQTNQLKPGEEGGTAGNVMVTGVPMDFPLELNLAIGGAQQLFYNWMMYCLPSGEGTVLCSDSGYWMESFTPDMMENNLNNNFGTNYDFIYDHSGTPLVAGGAPLYDMLYFSYDFLYEFNDIWYTLDEVTEYIEAGGHVFLPGDEFGAGTIWFLPWYVEYPSVAYSDFYLDFPGPAFSGSVEDIITDGVATGSWGFSYALHNDIKGYDENEWLPLFADPDPITTLIRPGGGMKYPKDLIVPETHVFGDNGKYAVDIQVLDDDMLWDLSGEQPVFTGIGDPMDFVSHNVFEVNIENTDPVISEVNAFAEMELSLRMSGEKKNSAVMRLYENGELLAGVTVDRDPGKPDIGVMSATIQMTKGYEYELTVEYLAEDGDGANPTWIFEAHFPDGKIKQLKHTFNSNDPTDRVWDLGSVKRMMLGHDIIFQATASDGGSDDLAYLWNFGDSTPHGIHLYANKFYTPAITPLPVNGASDESVALFEQLGDDRDPYFEYDANSERSPVSNPVTRLTDTITHIFDENQPYYYYVTLMVLDDDVEEPYPSTQLNPISGTDACYIEIELI